MLSLDKYFFWPNYRISPAIILTRDGFFTCGNRFWSIIHQSVLLWWKHIFYHKPVGSWRTYHRMLIGAHDSMIIIKNGGNAIYGASLVTPSLVPRLHLEKLISIMNCIITIQAHFINIYN